MHRDGRISHTLLKSIDGFRAELDGFDLPTLIQMVCARRVRLVLRVRSRDREGLLFFDEGTLVHAVAPGFVGEPAVHNMLSWESGEMIPVDRAWPQQYTIEGSAEALLLRAAQAEDETARLEAREQTLTKTRGETRRLEVVPPMLPRPHPAARPPTKEAAVRASVRLSASGELLAAEGDVEMFGELVAYVIRLGAVLGSELALEPFESLHAELGGERLVVFADGSDVVGLLLRPGATASELRRQLGH